MTKTFNETEFVFDEEITRLQDEIDELRAKVDSADQDNPQRREMGATLQQLESERKGAVWARDNAYENPDFPTWASNADSVTLGGLRAGPYSDLQNDLENDSTAGSGTTAQLLVAEGTLKAPYIDDGMGETERAAAVASLHPFYRMWAEARINELMDPESGNANF